MKENNLKKDFIWYTIGAAIPMIIGFIKTPIFTRYFSPTDFGSLALINTTYSYINIVSFSCFLSCMWRYYLHNKKSDELEKFYTNIIFLVFLGIISSTIISYVWSFNLSDVLLKKLIWSNNLNLIFSSTTTLYLISLRLDGESFKFNFFNIANSILSFLLLFVLVFVRKESIDAMLNCSNIINIIFSIYIAYIFLKKYKIKIQYISKSTLNELTEYGFGTIMISAGLLLLISADRYLIKIFYSTDKVGIYNQIYNLAQISIVAVTGIFFNVINPYLFKLFEEDINNEKEFYKYIFLYIIFFLPLTIYFCMYDKQIADLLLGEKFRIGYKMMPYIMISSFFYGLSVMHETRMKFKNKLKRISINIIIASAINIILNLVFIPLKGYEYAALMTLISYILLYAMDIYYDTKSFNELIFSIKSKYKVSLKIFFILLVQIILHYLIEITFHNYTVLYAIIEGIVFLSTFVVFIYINKRKLELF